ncbi:MAG: GxxExxY protein, partial [Planctomycetota bacterium]
KEFEREYPRRYDVLVDQCHLVDVKACEKTLPIHRAQILSYMKLLDIPLGLVINFNTLKLTDVVSRLVLPGTNEP